MRRSPACSAIGTNRRPTTPPPGQYGGDGVDPRGLFNRPYDPTVPQMLMMEMANIQSPDGTNVLFPLAVLAGNQPTGPWERTS